MRFWSGLPAVLVAATTVPHLVLAVECGQWYSNDCEFTNDIRYDPDASDAIKDQASVWHAVEGFYTYEAFVTAPRGTPVLPQYFDPSVASLVSAGIPYSRFPYVVYFNTSIVGSRYREHHYSFFAPPSKEFCDGVPDGLMNTLGSGECGVNGFLIPYDAYSVSTYERDGSLVDIKDPTARRYPIDSATIFSSSNVNGEGILSDTFLCLDDNCNRSHSDRQYFLIVNGRPQPLFTVSAPNITKLTQQEWLEGIEAAYEQFNVLPESRLPVPMVGECQSPPCPTQKEWCQVDPECSVTPYQEPDGTVNAGVIAGIIVAIFVVVFGAYVAFSIYSQRQRDRRLRTRFAQRIAETVQLTGSSRRLEPESLMYDFNKIDKASPDGFISKEKLWEFVSSGKAGELSRSDFEALYAAIDIDGDGRVDFVEFCAYLGRCHDEFQLAKGQRGSSRTLVAKHLSARVLEVSRSFSVKGDLTETNSAEGYTDEMAFPAAPSRALPLVEGLCT